MKMKKSGVYAALAVVLLITAALIVSCLDVIDPSGLNPQSQGTKAGYLTLIINDGNAKTALPTIPAIDHYFVVGTVATLDDDGDLIDPSDQEGTYFDGPVSSSGDIIAADEGTYSVSVTAYLTSDSSKPVATGTTTTNVVVGPGGGIANVTLKLISSTTGTFAWNLTLPQIQDPDPSANPGDMIDDFDSAKLSLAAYDSATGDLGTAVITDEDVSAGTGTWATPINSGNYWVTVTIEKAQHADRIRSELVHIRQNLTTTYSESFAALVPNTYTVRYFNADNLGDTTTPTSTQLNVVHGTNPSFPTPSNAVPASPLVSGGWYRESSYTNAWRPTDRIIKATDLYLRWVMPIAVTVNVTFDNTDISLTLEESGSNIITFSQASIINNSDVTFTIPAATVTSLNLTDIVWKCGNRTLGLGAELELDLSDPDNVDLLVLGNNQILVTVVVDGGAPKSKSFTLTITS